MRNRRWLPALILLVALFAGALAFFICYRVTLVPECCQNQPSAKKLGWLRHEYHLTNTQFERIAQLDADHIPRCAEMCQRVRDQRARLSSLIQAGNQTSPEVAEALKATAALELECRQATLTHIYAVAAVMSPEEGRRYITAMSASIIAPGMPGKSENCDTACDMAHPQ